MATDDLLVVEGLTVEADLPAGPVRLVDGLDLTLARGERLALVGESGSGKSVSARALLRLDRGLRLGGRVLLEGEDLLTAGERRLRAVRGGRIGMVFQDPMASLNPVMTIGDQVAESLRIRGSGRRPARQRARELLDRLGVPTAGRRIDAYPHELSGGMRQRVMLAMAVVGDPDVLVADEPTTALDVRVQAQVLDLVDGLARERGMAVLLITHDLGIVAGFADRVAVMYAGRKVEEAGVNALFSSPLHPYAQGLLGSVPRTDRDVGRRLVAIDGTPPSPAQRPDGCPFHPRCPEATDVCRTDVPRLRTPRGTVGLVACHHAPLARVEVPS